MFTEETKVGTNKAKFVPKPVVVDFKLASELSFKLLNDLNKGYFDNYPEVKDVIRTIREQCFKVIHNLVKDYTLTNLEAVTLKANDYIRDKYFRLPLWYQGGLYSY